MITLSQRNKKWALVGIGVIAVIVAAMMGFSTFQGQTPPASIVVPTPTSQQVVDNSLSLSPPSTPVAQVSMHNGCSLSLTFSVTAGNVNAEGTVGYALAAKNIGSVNCQSASISVYYGDGESFISSSPKATADGYYWAIGTMAPGKEYDVTLTTNRASAGTTGASTDEACLSANNGTDACANAGAASSPEPTTASNVVAQIATQVTTPSSYSSANGQEFGAWVWTPLTQMSAGEMQTVVNEAAANNFNTIYLTIDDYLNIVALPAGTNKQTQLQNYGQSVGEFLSLAKAKNINVEAEAGWRDWALPENADNAPLIMAFVASYNESHSIVFSGVQYDIEPYLLPQYQNDEGDVLTQYVQLVANLVTQDSYDHVPLTIVVPHFYDANEAWTPEVTVGGATDYTYPQILRLLNQLPNSQIIIMAYRNFASGSDGSIMLSQAEIQEADKTNVKVIVAQETGPVTPSYVTFYDTSRADLFGQVAAINGTFASDHGFGGIAIDYLDPFLDLP